MAPEKRRLADGATLAKVIGGCVAAFAAASVAAAVGYPSWMWVFVFAGLVFAPAVALVAIVAWAASRMTGTRDVEGGSRP
jgi:predicted branched-subunit amino acid permease